MDAPDLDNEAKLIDINNVPFAELDALPEFLRDKMKLSEEYTNRVRHQGNMESAGLRDRAPSASPDFNPDDVPF